MTKQKIFILKLSLTLLSFAIPILLLQLNIIDFKFRINLFEKSYIINNNVIFSFASFLFIMMVSFFGQLIFHYHKQKKMLKMNYRLNKHRNNLFRKVAKGTPLSEMLGSHFNFVHKLAPHLEIYSWQYEPITEHFCLSGFSNSDNSNSQLDCIASFSDYKSKIIDKGRLTKIPKRDISLVLFDSLVKIDDKKIIYSFNDEIIGKNNNYQYSILCLSTDLNKKIEDDRELHDFCISLFVNIIDGHFQQLEINYARAIAEHSAQLAALGEVSGGIAHEIYNPLTTISLLSHQVKKMIIKDNIDKEKSVYNLELVQLTIKRIVKIIDGLKYFARDSKDTQVEETTFERFFEDIGYLFRQKFENKEIKFEIEIPQELQSQTFYCRSIQLSQVFINLLNNAYRAVVQLGKNNKWVHIKLSEVNGKYQFIVSDSGNGIPKALQSKIFQPFFTTQEIGQGTGLGLSISKGIIEQHEGSFYLDANSPNTTFIIELPKIIVANAA